MEEDPREAFGWFYKSAMQGDGDAQYALGYFYEDGIGVERDIEEAREWYERSAAQGNRLAKKALKKL